MRQLLQDRNSGTISIEEVPAPVRTAAGLLVATRFSLISAGTERAAVEMGNKSLVGKARARPGLGRTVAGPAPRAAGARPPRDPLTRASAGRAAVGMGNKSLVGKARARPDLVRKVLESAREEGP